MSSVYNEFDKNPYEGTGTKNEEDWNSGYDKGYFAGLNRLEATYNDSDSNAFQSGYSTGYSTGLATE